MELMSPAFIRCFPQASGRIKDGSCFLGDAVVSASSGRRAPVLLGFTAPGHGLNAPNELLIPLTFRYPSKLGTVLVAIAFR